MTESTDLVNAERALTDGNHQEALRLSEELISLQPESAEAWFMKGKALFHLAEYIGASDAFKAAIDRGIEGSDRTSAESLADESKRLQTLKAVKRDWYQTDTHVVITILIKKVNVDDVHIDYGKNSLKFATKIPNSNDVVYDLNLQLAKDIVKEQCVFKVTASKIEIKLRKAESYRWNSLEADESEDSNVKTFEVAPQVAPTVSYPTSSKKPKDWNKLERDVKQEEKDEKPEGDAALNQLFQQIYGDASEETKRAMNKSFQESNGTVLSTNWSEIGAKKTEMQCPDGMEFKNY